MEKLIQQVKQASGRIQGQLAREYVRNMNGVTTEQLGRFEAAACRLMKRDGGVWGDLWLCAEGELVARELWGEE